MSGFLHDVAQAAAPVAVALLIGAALARTLLSVDPEDARTQRLAGLYLEPLSTWCLIAIAVYAVAQVAAGAAGLFSLSLALCAGGLAVLLRMVDEPEEDVAIETEAPPAAPPVPAAPVPVSDGPLWARPGRHST